MPVILDQARPYRLLAALVALTLATLVLFAGGTWVGHRWAAGSQAIEQRKGLERELIQLQAATKTLQTHAAQATANYYRATQRLNHIADLQERDREAQRQFNLQQQQELAALLRNRPDLRNGRAGTDVLQHWNRSNAGAGAAAPAAAAPDPSDAQGRMPGASERSQRPLGNPPGQPRPGGRAVPRLPQPAAEADASRVRLGGDSLGLVLHVRQPAAAPSGGVRP